MDSTGSAPISRDAFARVLGNPKVTAAFFLPIERAMWIGARYTLGGKASGLKMGQFTGVRLQAADASNRNATREREVQNDLVGLTRSLTEIRRTPALAGVVLSDEFVCGVDPAGVTRVRFGLAFPTGGRLTDEAAAAAECHEQIMRAIRRSGLRLTSDHNFDASRGFAGLEAWGSRVRLRPPAYAAAMKWGKVVAAVAVVGLALWLIPALGNAVVGAIRSGYTSCVAICRDWWGHFFPQLIEAGVYASDGDYTDRVHVRWDAVPNATGYRVFRGDPETPLVTLSGSATTEYDDTTAPVGEKFRYTVQGTTLFTRGPLGDGDDGHRNLMPPGEVVASDGRSTEWVEVTWKPVEHATRYQVLRDGVSLEPQPSDFSFRDSSATVGRQHRYQIQALTDVAVSQPSEADDGYRAPRPPSGLAAGDGTNSRGVDVLWNRADGANGYEIIRSGSAGEQTFRSNSNEWLDTDAQPGVKYRYVVKTLTDVGSSGPSNGDDGWRGFEKPVSIASDGTFVDRITVEWTPIPHATSYRIVRDGMPLPATVEAGTARDRVRFEDKDVQPGRTYSYSVQPVTTAGAAPASDPDRGWRSIAAPAQVMATPGDFTDKVIVRWQPVKDALGYRVFRDDAEIGKVSSPEVSMYEDKTAVIGQLYKYSVKTECSAGPGPASQSSAGYRNLDPPQAVKATVTEPGEVTISWGPVQGATGYQIFRVGKKAAIGFTFAHGDTSFSDVQVPDQGGTFRYTVKAKTDTVTGPASDQSPEVIVPSETERPADAERDVGGRDSAP